MRGDVAAVACALHPDGNEDNTDKRTYDIIGRFYFFELSKKF